MARSSITGRGLTTRAIGYELWRLSEGRFERATPPALPAVPRPGQTVEQRLVEMREEVIIEVRDRLTLRARRHLQQLERGGVVHGLRMTGTSEGARILPAGAWHGLPGLYSSDWPTPIGLPGEAPRCQAEEAVRRGVCELETLDADALRIVISRFRTQLPDDAAVAEGMAKCFNRREAYAVERHVERLLVEARTYEYRHPPEHTGRRRLP